MNADPVRDFGSDWNRVPAEVWKRTRMVFVCTPGNPAGNVMSLDDWKTLFELSDRHDFVIVSDECYSEIYLDEANPPLGGLQAARRLGRDDYRNLVAFSSLSKRSNVPGLRSGFVAGDAALIGRFLLYRTYHGSAMSPLVSAASIAAWTDEAHVKDNRRMYREKFDAVVPILQNVLDVTRPQASSTCGRPRPVRIRRSRATFTAVPVLPCCRAASWRARRTGRIPARAASASPWWRPWPTACRRPNALPILCILLFDQPLKAEPL